MFATFITARRLYAFIVLSCTALLGYALYTEKFLGLNPCPLCITQRGFYVLAALFAFVALLHNPGVVGRWIYAGLLLLSTGLGAAVAGRQVWLQSLPPDQVPACGPSLEYMLEALPLSTAFKTLMMGDGNCAEVVWTFLGQSMPTWSLIWFVALALVSLASLKAR